VSRKARYLTRSLTSGETLASTRRSNDSTCRLCLARSSSAPISVRMAAARSRRAGSFIRRPISSSVSPRSKRAPDPSAASKLRCHHFRAAAWCPLATSRCRSRGRSRNALSSRPGVTDGRPAAFPAFVKRDETARIRLRAQRSEAGIRPTRPGSARGTIPAAVGRRSVAGLGWREATRTPNR